MRHKYSWRKPLELHKVDASLWETKYRQFLEAAQFLKITPPELTEELTDVYLHYRWGASKKLIVRVSKRIVEVLASTVFEDIKVRDIYLPEGVDCVQIVGENDDSLLQQNIILFKHCDNVQLPPFVMMTGTSYTDIAVLLLKESDDVQSARLTLRDGVTTQVNPEYISLVAAIGFLADSDEAGLFRHEVLSRDKEKYERAILAKDEKLTQFLEDRAIRNNKNERILDTFELEVGESAPPNEGTCPSQGNSKKPHLRRGHFRAVRHGTGRRQVKMKWIPPTLVRRDLI